MQRARFTITVAGEAAGFADEENSRSQVPGFQIALPKGVKAACRDIPKLKGYGAKPANADGLGLNERDLSAVVSLALAAAKKVTGA